MGRTLVWDVVTGRLTHTCQAAGSRAATVTTDRLFTTVSFSPDGATFFAGIASVGNTYGEPVRLWDTRTGKLRQEFDGRRPLALSPDGNLLATGGKSIVLRDVRSGDVRHKLFGYLKKTQSIAYSPDGRLIYSGGSYNTLNAWEVVSGRHLITLFAFPIGQGAAAMDDWLAYTSDGFYDGSPGVARYVACRVGDELRTGESLGPQFHRPEQVQAALTLPAPETGAPQGGR
jgi:WD40 repeat protein